MKIVRSTANEFTHYCLYYRINPRRVMDENNYIGLFDAVDTDVMLNRVNRFIQGIHKLLPITDDCKINRIDFCVNVRMAGQKEISEYISLLQRVCCPDKYALETFYDSKSKRKKPKKNSCNIIKENMLKLVFYNKYDQLRENKHCKNIDEAKNILRIEIQCFKKKVRHLSDKFGYTHVRTFLKHSDSVGDYVFRKYIKKCYGAAISTKLMKSEK